MTDESYQELVDRQREDYVYVKKEYQSTLQKLFHYLRWWSLREFQRYVDTYIQT